MKSEPNTTSIITVCNSYRELFNGINKINVPEVTAAQSVIYSLDQITSFKQLTTHIVALFKDTYVTERMSLLIISKSGETSVHHIAFGYPLIKNHTHIVDDVNLLCVQYNAKSVILFFKSYRSFLPDDFKLIIGSIGYYLSYSNITVFDAIIYKEDKRKISLRADEMLSFCYTYYMQQQQKSAEDINTRLSSPEQIIAMADEFKLHVQNCKSKLHREDLQQLDTLLETLTAITDTIKRENATTLDQQIEIRQIIQQCLSLTSS